MTDRLAGLVLPDRTPIDESAPPSREKRPGKARPAKSPPGRKPAAKNRGGRSASDWAIIGFGLALAGACAVFPWYIFYNQEDFGTNPVTFRIKPATTEAVAPTAMPDLVGARDSIAEIPPPNLDMQSTGTVPQAGRKTVQAPGDQPFPEIKPDFKLVLVANGRAMVEDEDGYWVVQTGSWLPDGSSVASIEKRQGKWALVTSRNAVIALDGS